MRKEDVILANHRKLPEFMMVPAETVSCNWPRPQQLGSSHTPNLVVVVSWDEFARW